ncbi:MAG: hypothetical protein WC312_00075 [Candidatus Omnitrophota bacterium]|jgi:hypothetical protein
MIIREKLIFWFTLPLLAAVIAAGINMQEKKRQSSDEFLQDIEAVTEKARAKKKTAETIPDIDGLKAQEAIEDYALLMERGIFSKPVSETGEEKEEAVVLKKEEPEKPMFVYKGRMTLGDKVIVIIQDESTGKSFSVKEGDVTEGFTVLRVGEKEIMLKKKDGEEVMVPTVKEEKKEAAPEDAGIIDEKE